MQENARKRASFAGKGVVGVQHFGVEKPVFEHAVREFFSTLAGMPPSSGLRRASPAQMPTRLEFEVFGATRRAANCILLRAVSGTLKRALQLGATASRL